MRRWIRVLSDSQVRERLDDNPVFVTTSRGANMII